MVRRLVSHRAVRQVNHQPSGAPGQSSEVGGLKWLADTSAGDRHLHDPAGADPSLADVLRCRLYPQHPGDVTTMADLVIGCRDRDLPLSLELATDLAVQGLLVGYSFGEDCVYDRQQEVGPLLLELPKNGFWVCRASAWISTRSRSSSPSSCLSTARSWFSPVA